MNHKKILVISDVPSHPQSAGNRTRIHAFLTALKNMGHEIHFLYENREISRTTPQKPDIKAMKKTWDKVYVISPLNKYTITYFIDKNLGKMGALLKKSSKKIYTVLKRGERKFRIEKPQEIDEKYNPAINKILDRLSKQKFDAVISEYVYNSKALRYFPEALRVIDTHDSLTSKIAIDSNKEFPYFSVYSKKEEAKTLNRADVIIAIQEEEAKFFKTLVDKNKKVITIGHLTELKKQIRPNNRKNIFFIGFINHANDYGMKFFIKEVFPKIREKHLNSKLIIVGDICKILPSGKNIIKLGKVKDIEKAYSLADIVICPLLFGTGLKIKNIEALAHGKPLITTDIGIKGIEKGKNKAFLIADTAKEFSEAIEKIFSDKKLYKNLSRNAHKFMKEYNQKNIKILKSIF